MRFYNEFGNEDKIELEENKDKMKVNWYSKDWFQLLKQRIMNGMMYNAFAGKPTRNKDALNMVMVIVVARTKVVCIAKSIMAQPRR